MRSDFSYTQHSLSVSDVLIFTLFVALIHTCILFEVLQNAAHLEIVVLEL